MKEVELGTVDLQPGSMAEEFVDFVGNDELFQIDVLAAKRGNQVDRHGEIDVAVIVAVDEQHRRAPGAYAGNWRPIVGSENGFLARSSRSGCRRSGHNHVFPWAASGPGAD